MSMSDILAALLFLLVPLRHNKADRRMAKDTFALIQDKGDIIIIIIIMIMIMSIWHPGEDKEKEKIENYEDLKWTWNGSGNWQGIVVNWCRNCLERHRKVVSRDWCHMSFRVFAENVLTGYSQNPSQSLGHLKSRAVRDLLFKEDSSQACVYGG